MFGFGFGVGVVYECDSYFYYYFEVCDSNLMCVCVFSCAIQSFSMFVILLPRHFSFFRLMDFKEEMRKANCLIAQVNCFLVLI